MQAVTRLSEHVGVRSACEALNVHRSAYYRYRQPSAPEVSARPEPPLKLSAEERRCAHEMLLSPRFVDQAPASIVATLLDEGKYLCSERTMYRILAENHQLKERRRGHRQAHYAKPELLATAPNQCWSWDITKLKGPRAWSHFYLYVILDIFSRYVVGWMVADAESATLAKQLIAATCEKQAITPEQLTLHADRGSSMKSKLVAQLLSDLGVTKTHSRPYTSDDNPYSEAQFKTLKYRPDFPRRFGCLEDAKAHCRQFFHWYNQQHLHSGIAMLTPVSVHYGQAQDILNERHQVLVQAAEQHPLRFKRQQPKPAQLPQAVWINKPDREDAKPSTDQLSKNQETD